MKTTKTHLFENAGEVPRAQYGALCWRMHRGAVQVLLVTSRDTGRWVVPKGWPMEDLPPFDAAAREAWEEAGAEGTVNQTALGEFSYIKTLGPKLRFVCTVGLYPLQVARLAKRFPERAERRRKWFDAEKAARKVAEPELRAILLAVAADPGGLPVDPGLATAVGPA